MDNLADKAPVARLSRSGPWLIGGVLLASLAVIGAYSIVRIPYPAKSKAGSPLSKTHSALRTAPAPFPAKSKPSSPSSKTKHAPLNTPAPPAEADYAALLQGNVFQPRVVPPRSRSGAGPAAAAPGKHGGAGAAPGGPVTAPAWHDWDFSGTAQIDQQTYALMDQPEKKQSQFVRVGDRLEDATVIAVAESAVTLRQADGSIVRVKQTNPAAEQRAARAVAAAAAAAPAGAAPAGGTPAAPLPGQGSAPPLPSGQVAPAPAATGNYFPAGGGFGRRSRRSPLQDGAGDPGLQ